MGVQLLRRGRRGGRRHGGHRGGGSWGLLWGSLLRQKWTLQFTCGGKDEAEVMSFMCDEALMSASCCLPGRDAATDVLALASKLCSLCLNTSRGLKDRWEISDLASCSGFQTAAGSVAFPPHKYKHSLTLPGVRSYSRWLSAQTERS